MSELQFDLLVIGAGIAGLSAARALAGMGRRVALVEGRDRAGGRIHSMKTSSCALPIELGAEFVHGRPPELLALISQAGKTCFEVEGDQLCFSRGHLAPCARDGAFSVLESLPEEPDLAFSEWISKSVVEKRFSPSVARSATAYVEGFNAADARRIGTASLARQQGAEDAIEGGRAFRVEQGYATLAEYLLDDFTRAGGEVFLSTVVHAIEWRRGAVRVLAGEVGQPHSFAAERCIVTLPLGVLQAGSVRFDPVPQRAMDAAKRLAMGTAKRIVFVFRERFWAVRYPNARFVFSEDEDDIPATWWTASPKNVPMLTGWIGGPRAGRPSVASGEDLMRTSVATLMKIFALTEPEMDRQLLSWHSHDWQKDPLSRGAYSYVPQGALEALSTLAEPVDETLFFAGEHTDGNGHWGTVHGALRSGLRAAEQVRRFLL